MDDFQREAYELCHAAKAWRDKMGGEVYRKFNEPAGVICAKYNRSPEEFKKIAEEVFAPKSNNNVVLDFSSNRFMDKLYW